MAAKTLSWIKLDEVSEMHGEAFYLLDLEQFQANFDRFTRCFRKYYPSTSLGYSFKTNYLPALCREAYEQGAYAEVVSRMEYDLALTLGIPAERIIFNGPLKLRDDLETALLNGSTVNLDSPTEVEFVRELVTTYPNVPFSVGLRCNFDIGTKQRSRFGLDVETGQLRAGFKVLDEIDNCSVEGLHFHSSALRTSDSYVVRTRKLLDVSEDLFGHRIPTYLDLGGGFFGNMPDELKVQFGTPIPEYEDYAEAIAPAFAERFGTEDGPELILEPGVALVADVMRFAVRVVDVRTIGGRTIATTTGSVQNIKPSPNRINLPITVYAQEQEREQCIDLPSCELVGYTCMEMDVLHHGCHFELAKDDFVVFDQVGAYSFVFKPPFIRTAPPILTYHSTLDCWEVLRREETLADVMRSYASKVNTD